MRKTQQADIPERIAVKTVPMEQKIREALGERRKREAAPKRRGKKSVRGSRKAIFIIPSIGSNDPNRYGRTPG